VAMALGERDVKAEVTSKNMYVAVALGDSDVKADVTAKLWRWPWARGTSKQTLRLRTGTWRGPGREGRQSRRHCQEQVRAVALRERDVKEDVTAKNRYWRWPLIKKRM
jgi:hypothetical protein